MGQNHTLWLVKYSWSSEDKLQTKVFPLGTAKWVEKASHGHSKAKTGLAFSVNLEPNTARADVWMAASIVDLTAVQRSCSSATLHFARTETIGTMRMHPADSTMDIASSSHRNLIARRVFFFLITFQPLLASSTASRAKIPCGRSSVERKASASN